MPEVPNPPPKQDPSQEKQRSKRKQQVDAYLKYSGMAFQLAGTLLVGTFIGKKLDDYFQTDRPYLTALFALLSLFAGLYLVLKDLLFNKK